MAKEQTDLKFYCRLAITADTEINVYIISLRGLFDNSCKITVTQYAVKNEAYVTPFVLMWALFGEVYASKNAADKSVLPIRAVNLGAHLKIKEALSIW